jgi:hypothetical protein
MACVAVILITRLRDSSLIHALINLQLQWSLNPADRVGLKLWALEKRSLPRFSIHIVEPHCGCSSGRAEIELKLPDSCRSPSTGQSTRGILSQRAIAPTLAADAKVVKPEGVRAVVMNFSLEMVPVVGRKRGCGTRNRGRNPTRIGLIPDIVNASRKVALTAEHVVPAGTAGDEKCDVGFEGLIRGDAVIKTGIEVEAEVGSVIHRSHLVGPERIDIRRARHTQFQCRAIGGISTWRSRYDRTANRGWARGVAPGIARWLDAGTEIFG